MKSKIKALSVFSNSFKLTPDIIEKKQNLGTQVVKGKQPENNLKFTLGILYLMIKSVKKVLGRLSNNF